MRRALVHLIGTFFGTGYAPIAPATAGSFAYALLWWGLWNWLGPIALWVQLIALVAVTVVGIAVAGALEREHGPDPRRCVIDEVAGMQVTYLGLAAGWPGWLAGFFWFRVFDIWKPGGVRKLERLPGGVGIMADDLGAGVLAALATHATVAAARLLGWWT
jgi:phosphatidylglycerophosphatase A